MENTEIIEYEDVEVVDTVEASEGTGMSTGVAMLTGAGLMLAITAGVKAVKKGIAKWKAKKEARKHDNEDYVDVDENGDIVDK